MKALAFIAVALLLVGCEDTYRYPCQDPVNANKPECNRPICEADGMCFDTLNGLPPKQAEEIAKEEAAEVESEVTQTTSEVSVDEVNKDEPTGE
jgi:hypothetical protein